MTPYALIPIRYAYLPIEKIPALLVPALPLFDDPRFFIYPVDCCKNADSLMCAPNQSQPSIILFLVAEQVVTVVGPSGQPMQVPVSAVLASQNINPEAMKTAVTNAVQNMGINWMKS